MKTIAISGYKAHELSVFDPNHKGIYYIKKALSQRLIPLIEEGLEWVIISGQLGVELWAAEVVYSLKAEYPHIQLAVLTPFLNQESVWKDETRAYYEQVINQADFVRAITNRPYESPAQLKLKNEYIISKVDGLLLLYDEEMVGSPKFYLEAGRKRQMREDFPIYFITPTDIDFIIQDENF